MREKIRKVPVAVTILFLASMLMSLSSGVATASSNMMIWQQLSLSDKLVSTVELDPGNPTTMYASLSGGNYDDAGLWKSIDGGSNWSHVLNYAMDDCSVDPRNSLNVCAAGAGIYTTVNGGTSWSQRVAGSEYYGKVLRDPTNPSIIYVTYRYAEVYKSIDNGLSWNHYQAGTAWTMPFDIVIEPTNHNVLYILSGYDEYVLKSTNGGAGWTPIQTGLPINPNVVGIDVDPRSPGHLVLALYQGVYESVDAGGSWQLLGTGLPNEPNLEDIQFDTGNSSIIYAAAYDHCYISQDGGADWQDQSTGLEGGGFATMTPHPTTPGIVYGAGNYGIYVGSWKLYDPSTWYLAEGSTNWGYSCYVSIENPNGSAAPISVIYNTSDKGAVQGPSFTMPAGSQATINPADTLGAQDFSTKVTSLSGAPIAVDRTMGWNKTGQEEAHCSVGVTAPDTTWYLPEGSASWGFECWLLIQNPNSQQANCQVTYMVENAGPRTVTKTVPANTRATFNMANDLQDVSIKDASIKVTSDVPVIPERAMYRNNRREGHDSIGTTMPARDYYLAEGATGYNVGYITYVLVQNPNVTATDVNITYQTGSGTITGPSFRMDPNSRKTVKVNDQLGNNTDVSTHVSGSQPIIAERAMYWNNGTGEACHDSIGMASPHKTFYLPDGQSSSGRETWTLVQNPNSSDVQVDITYMTPSGTGNITKTETIPANSRKTFNMATHSGINGRAAIVVSSRGLPVMVERAMYWNSRGAGTDTIGGYSD